MIVKVDDSNIDDAALIHSVSWQESHRSFCPAEFVALHTPARQKGYLQNKIDSGTVVYMLIEDGPAGIVSVTDSLIEDLYIYPVLQNRGCGTVLLRFAMKHCAGVPTLWILENNMNAARLYRREGFVETGNRNHITDGLDEIEFQFTGNRK